MWSKEHPEHTEYGTGFLSELRMRTGRDWEPEYENGRAFSASRIAVARFWPVLGRRPFVEYPLIQRAYDPGRSGFNGLNSLKLAPSVK
jgi:hypothetical protein